MRYASAHGENSDNSVRHILEETTYNFIGKLLSYDHAPFMFHQANLRRFPWNNEKGLWPLSNSAIMVNQDDDRVLPVTFTSLTSLFVEYMIDGFSRTTLLPIMNMRFADIVRSYHERMDVDAAGLSVSFVTGCAGKCITGVRISTIGACIVPITGALAENFRTQNQDKLIASLVYADDLTLVRKPDNVPLYRQRYGPDRTIFVQMGAGETLVVPYDNEIQWTKLMN